VESSPTSKQRRTGGSGGSNRRRLGHPGARPGWGKERGDHGEYVGMLTGAEDEARRPEIEEGRPVMVLGADGSASMHRWCSGARLAKGIGGGDVARRDEAPGEVNLLRETAAATNRRRRRIGRLGIATQDRARWRRCSAGGTRASASAFIWARHPTGRGAHAKAGAWRWRRRVRHGHLGRGLGPDGHWRASVAGPGRSGSGLRARPSRIG
jgi:hypothetical protein